MNMTVCTLPGNPHAKQFVEMYNDWVSKYCSPSGFYSLVCFLKETRFLDQKQIYDFERSLALPDSLNAMLRRGMATVGGLDCVDVIPSETVVIEKPDAFFGQPAPKSFLSGEFKTPAGRISRIKNASFWFALRQQAVIKDGCVVADLTNHAGMNSIQALKTKDAIKLTGTTAVLYTEGAALLSHFMFDLLPKFHVLKQSGIELSAISQFIVTDYAMKFHKEAFYRLGIPLEKLVVPNGEKRYFDIEEAVVVDKVRNNFVGAPWVFDSTRKIYRSDLSANRDDMKIYLSRSRAARRRVVNEKELIGDLYDRGFTTIWAEEMNVRTIAEIMNSSKVLVSLHGAGIANAVFAKPGLRIVELYGRHISPEYAINSSVCGFKHWLLGARDSNGDMPWDAKTGADFHADNAAEVIVDKRDFCRALDEICA